MNASTGLAIQPASFTEGTVGRTTGWCDHCRRALAIGFAGTRVVAVAAATPGGARSVRELQGTPSLTHRVKMSISPARKLAARRHLQLLVADRLEKHALLRPIETHGRTEIPSLRAQPLGHPAESSLGSCCRRRGT